MRSYKDSDAYRRSQRFTDEGRSLFPLPFTDETRIKLPPLGLEVGKIYATRDGGSVLVVRENTDSWLDGLPFVVKRVKSSTIWEGLDHPGTEYTVDADGRTNKNKVPNPWDVIKTEETLHVSGQSAMHS